jgi:hypothetical protein
MARLRKIADSLRENAPVLGTAMPADGSTQGRDVAAEPAE